MEKYCQIHSGQRWKSRLGGIAIENHPNDSRVGIAEDGVIQTLTGRMGTGGGNTPLVMCYGICAQNSGAMQSSNPYSGVYEAKTSRTLDCHGGNPSCNQGGIAVVEERSVYCLQGNMIGRKEENGPQGAGVNEDVSFTLTGADRHAVSYAMQAFGDYRESDVGSTCKARDYRDATDLIQTDTIVRRITPLECGRMQGFPDSWVDELAEENPLAQDVRFWSQTWAEWWHLIGREKGIKMPKNEKEVRRWLSKDASDSDLYKMWGNGIALPCAAYVLEGIASELNKS